MNAFDRLNRSVAKLPGRAGDTVTVCGQPLRGLFHEQPGDSEALGMIRGTPLRTATLQLALVDLGAIAPREGDPVQAVGESWICVAPFIRRGDGFVTLTLEYSP